MRADQGMGKNIMLKQIVAKVRRRGENKSGENLDNSYQNENQSVIKLIIKFLKSWSYFIN
jgi:hypothetical protein